MRPAGLLLSLVLLPAAQAGTLTGTFTLQGETVIDPPPQEPRDTHMLIVLNGASAKSLYQSMKSKAAPDACAGNGTLAKTVGGMRCTKSGTRYECDFSIDIARQAIKAGQAC